MKKSLSLLAIAAGLTLAAHPASAAYNSPYAFKSKLPPVQVDMSAMNDVGRYPAAPAAQPMVSIPGLVQNTPAPVVPAPVTAAPLTPASGGISFLDEIMSYHTGNGAKKKSTDDNAAIARPVNAAPIAAPVAPPVVAPVAAPVTTPPLAPRLLPAPVVKPAALPPLSIPATAQPVSQPAPVVMETPVITTPVIDAAIAPLAEDAKIEAPVIVPPATNTVPAPAAIEPMAEITPVVPAPVATPTTAAPVIIPVTPAPAAEPAPTVPVIVPAPAAEPAAITEPEEAPPVVRSRNTRRTPAADTKADLVIAFTQNSSALTPQEEANLAALAADLVKDPSMRLQLRAYATDTQANATNARRTSLSRGLLVRAYLIEKGISPAAIDVRALGMDADKPADTVEVVVVK